MAMRSMALIVALLTVTGCIGGGSSVELTEADLVAAAPDAPRSQNARASKLRTFSHSSGLFSIDLPADWATDELVGDVPQLVAAPDIAAYQASWDADGIYVSVVENTDREAALGLVEANIAARECRELDRATDGRAELVDVEVTYDCDGPAPVTVRVLWRADNRLAVVMFLQHDGLPTVEDDLRVADEVVATLSAPGQR